MPRSARAERRGGRRVVPAPTPLAPRAPARGRSTSVGNGKITAPGFVRVDMNASATGCRRVWTNTTESAPTVVSKMSLANGLIYSYTTDSGGDWYWTALDYRTGKVVYKVYAGTGLGYNNNYAGISISPAGSEYLGTLGGIIALRDG